MKVYILAIIACLAFSCTATSRQSVLRVTDSVVRTLCSAYPIVRASVPGTSDVELNADGSIAPVTPVTARETPQ